MGTKEQLIDIIKNAKKMKAKEIEKLIRRYIPAGALLGTNRKKFIAELQELHQKGIFTSHLSNTRRKLLIDFQRWAGDEYDFDKDHAEIQADTYLNNCVYKQFSTARIKY